MLNAVAVGPGPGAGAAAPADDYEALAADFRRRQNGRFDNPAALARFVRSRGLGQEAADRLRDHLQRGHGRPLLRVRAAAEGVARPAPREALREAQTPTAPPFQTPPRDRSHPGYIKMPYGLPKDGSPYISMKVLSPHVVEIGSALASPRSYSWPAADTAVRQALSAYGKTTSIQWVQRVNNWLWRHSMPGDQLVLDLNGNHVHVIDRDGIRRNVPLV